MSGEGDFAAASSEAKSAHLGPEEVAGVFGDEAKGALKVMLGGQTQAQLMECGAVRCRSRRDGQTVAAVR